MDGFVGYAFTFLAGTATGAAGAYFAQKFTDDRRRKEAKSEWRKAFRRLEARMPALFAELRSDISGDATGLVREVVVLSTRGVTFNSSKPRFAYYESQHVNLKEQIHHLVSAGFLEDVTSSSTPIYRMTEDFYQMLSKWSPTTG